MSYEGAERALFEKLITVIPNWKYKTAGIPFTPPTGEPWMRGTFLPARPQNAGFGQGRYSRLVGIYQVDLFYPIKLKTQSHLMVQVNKIIRLYYPEDQGGQILKDSENTTEVLVDEMPGLSPLFEGDVYLQRSVDIYWRSDSFPNT